MKILLAAAVLFSISLATCTPVFAEVDPRNYHSHTSGTGNPIPPERQKWYDAERCYNYAMMLNQQGYVDESLEYMAEAARLGSEGAKRIMRVNQTYGNGRNRN